MAASTAASKAAHGEDLVRAPATQVLLEVLERSGLDLVVEGGLGDPATRADPQLAVARIGEELVGLVVAAPGDVERGAGPEAPGAMSSTASGSRHPVRLEEVSSGAEAVVAVVGADLEVPVGMTRVWPAKISQPSRVARR